MNHWYGNPKDIKTRQHMEIKIHQLLDDRKGSEHCAKMVHSETDDERMFYSLYLTYYPHGDLIDLISMYKTPQPKRSLRPKSKKSKKVEEDELGKKQDFITEPFVWSVFETLTEACLLLDTGAVLKKDAVSDWEPIVHRDIKPHNIFLDSPRNTKYPSYPHVVLSDFGIAILTAEDDPLNPAAYNATDGTPGWQPPEMLTMLNRETWRPAPVGKLSSKTNVWGIGAVMTALMNQNEIMEGTTFAMGEEQPVLNENTSRYSDQLRQLVQQCTEYWPNERTDLRKLRKSIRKHTVSKKAEGGDFARGMGSRKHEIGDKRFELRYHKNDPCEMGAFAETALKAME